MNNTIVVETEQQLSQLTLQPKPQLTSLPSYSFFLDRVERGYQSYLTNNPGADTRPYQIQHAAMMCCRHNNFMGWDMRSGKTLTSLLVIYGLYNGDLSNVRAGSIHIAVPSILASMSWIAELKRFTEFAEQFSVVKSDKELRAARSPIIIYNYDFPKGKVRGRTCLRSKVLRKLRPNLLIIDEIHGLKGGSQRTKQLTQLRSSCKRVLGLSGTPSEGTLTEIHNLMSFVYRKQWPYHKPEHFVKEFGTKQKLTSNYIYGSNRQEGAPEKFLQQLDINKMPSYYNLMLRFMHRLNLSDPEVAECITIPDTEAVMHCVTPTEAQIKLQTAYIDQHKAQLERAANALTIRQRAEALQLINPLIEIANFTDVTSPKLDKVVKIVNQAEGKVVVYCHRVTSAWLCAQTLRQALGEDKVVRVYAKDWREDPTDLTQEQRIDFVTQFQYDYDVKVGVFSINLASEAIELNAASDVIFYCLPWSSIQIRQAISRPVGPGNPFDVVKLHYLYHRGFIDEYQVMLAVSKIKSSRLIADYAVDYNEDDDLSPTDAIRKLLS